jgi:hypothetical protein
VPRRAGRRVAGGREPTNNHLVDLIWARAGMWFRPTKK